MSTGRRVTESRPDGVGIGNDGQNGQSFYFSPEFYQRLDLLKHLTLNSSNVPLVSGPAGVGKTTLLDQFEAAMDPDWILCRIESEAALQPARVLEQLVHTFGAQEDASGPEAGLITRLGRLQQARRQPVIALDDAHLCPGATLTWLSSFLRQLQARQIHVGLMLFAQPEIEQLLPPEDWSLQRLQLSPLDREQAMRMIDRLLRIRGRDVGPSVSTGQIKRIYRASGGLPGRIRAQLDLLLDGRGVAAVSASGERPLAYRSLLIGGLALALPLGLVLFYQDDINRLLETPQPVLDDTRSPLESQPVERPAELPVASLETRDAGIELLPAIPEEIPVVALALPPQPEIEPMVAPPAEVAGDPRDGVPVPVGSPGEILATPPSNQATKDQPPVSSQPDIPSTSTLAAAPTHTIQPKVEPSAPVVTQPPVREQKPQVAPATVKIPPPPDGIQRESWLKRQKPTAYTLQLIGVKDESSIPGFIERHKLRGELAYFRSMRNGAPWYSLVYGVYSDRAAAVTARSKLPASLRRGVWPRTIASIQQAITAP